MKRKKKLTPTHPGLSSGEYINALISAAPSIRALSVQYLGPGYEDDVFQETALRGWRSLKGFKRKSAPRTWLYAIARNVCADFFNNRTREREAISSLKKVPTGKFIPSAEIQVEISQFFERISAKERRLISAAMTQSMETVAKKFKSPVGTIKHRIYKIRRREDK